MREVNKNILSFIFHTLVSYNILKTQGKNIFEYTITYTRIDMTFLRPRFAKRDKFLIPYSGNKYKTLMYRIQPNGKRYIYNEYHTPTNTLIIYHILV